MAWFQALSTSARKAKKKPLRNSSFQPSVERLESRDVPTTAALSGGVLTINGTTGNDSIVLAQSSGQVSVSGVTTKFATSSINSVVINGGGGSDSISLSGLKAQPWTKPVTVNTT